MEFKSQILLGVFFTLWLHAAAQPAAQPEQTQILDSLKELQAEENHEELLQYAGNVLLSVDSAQGSPWFYSQLTNYLGSSYLMLGMNDSAAKYLHQSLISVPKDSLFVLAKTYEKYARSMTWRGLMDSSIVTWNSTLDIYVQLNDSSNIRRIVTNIGLSHSSKGDFFKALEYQMKGYEIAQSLGQEMESRTTMVTIADTYHLLDEYDKALYYFRTALGDEQDTILSDFWKAIIQWNMGGVYLSKGSYDSAIMMAREPMEFYKNESNVCYGIYPTGMVAESFLKLGEYDSAFHYASQALEGAEVCGENYIQTVCHILIGQCYYEWGENQKAEKWWKDAYGFATDPERKGELSGLLAEFYEHKNMADSALKYHKVYSEIEDTQVSKEKIRDIAKLEKEYEVREESMRIESEYEAQLLGEQLKSERANRLTLILAVVVLAILVISVLLYRLYHVKKQANDELVAKNQLIEQQKTELEALNAAKEKMISLLSHDIRNPLFGLEGSLNMLIEGAIDEEDFKQSARNTRHKLRSISDFLDNMLRWAKSQLTGINPNMRSVDAAQLLNETIDLLQANISAKQLTVENHVKANTFVKADYEMIQTVVRNVLSKAGASPGQGVCGET